MSRPGTWLIATIGVIGCASAEVSITSGEGVGRDGGGGCISASDCDDGDACTADACQAGTCVHMKSCCQIDSDCNDGKACTDDSCVGGSCKNMPRGGCCETDADC